VEAQKDGTLNILDKRTNNSYTGLNLFLDGGDCGDEYNFCPPTTDQMIAPRLKHANITRGPIQQVLELELELTTPLTLAPDRRSRSPEQTTNAITTRITLTKNIPRVDINTSISNCARDHRLRVHFPAPFVSETSVQDGHFEVVERRIGLPDYDETWVEQPRPEVPQRAFSTITDGLCGLTIANRGLTEVEVMKNSAGNAEIAITLMRCIGWLSRDDLSTRKGHAGPFLETPGAQLPGNWVFDYSIIPHSGGWQNGFAEAYAFESPLRLIPTGLHVGTFTATGSFLMIEPATFVVSAVKQCENGSGWILRGYNITGETIHVSIKLWKTFTKVMQINLAEEELSILKPDKEGRITIPVEAKKILSLSFLN
jgi:mannosylglycerate hydrolase